MKIIPILFLGSALVSLMAAENPAIKAPATWPKMAATDAPISAPLVLKDSAVSQPAQTEVGAGGKAILPSRSPKPVIT